MEMSVFGVLVLFVSVFFMWVEVNLAQGGNVHVNARKYISWDDLKVDEHRLRLNSNNEGRVIVVDQHGRGHSRTVQGAVDMVPDHNKERVKIYIYPGIYREKVFVPKSKPYVSFIGKRDKTAGVVITWNNKASDRSSNGQELGTFGSATVGVESDYFCATGITFQNSVVAVAGGHGMQAVALRVDSNRAVFYRVSILGTQDTLLDSMGKHYFYKCYIQGNVDFIFGNAKSLYEDCHLQSTAKSYGAIAAHHRNSPNEDTGFSFLGCEIQGTGTNVLLGRAWGDYARIIYSFCYMDNIIASEGWSEWQQASRKKTAVFGEFQCRGRGADRSGRVPWSKSFHYEEARPFMGKSFINGDQWLRL